MLVQFLFATLTSLSIMRLAFVPFIGKELAVQGTAFCSILLSLLIFRISKYSLHIFIVLSYCLLMLIVTSTTGEYTLWDLTLGLLETISPYIIIGSFCIFNVRSKLKLTKKFVIRLVTLLLGLLILGQFLTLIGIRLPIIYGLALTNELSTVIEFTNLRMASFVGTSGPFSMALTYLLISMQILLPKRFLFIAIIGSIVEIVSFSRLGLILFLTFNIICLSNNLIKRYNYKIKKSNIITLVVGLSITFYFISYIQIENLISIIQRITNAFNFVSDKGNEARIEQWLNMILNVKSNNIFSILFGDGTALTARALGGEQGESQILKIYVEWGLSGLLIFTYWLLRSTNILVYNNFKLIYKSEITFIAKYALFITIFLNCLVLQIFTSSPGFISMGLAVLSLNVANNESNKRIKI